MFVTSSAASEGIRWPVPARYHGCGILREHVAVGAGEPLLLPFSCEAVQAWSGDAERSLLSNDLPLCVEVLEVRANAASFIVYSTLCTSRV